MGIVLEGRPGEESGLIDSLRELVANELASRNGGSRIGSLIDRYA